MEDLLVCLICLAILVILYMIADKYDFLPDTDIKYEMNSVRNHLKCMGLKPKILETPDGISINLDISEDKVAILYYVLPERVKKELLYQALKEKRTTITEADILDIAYTIMRYKKDSLSSILEIYFLPLFNTETIMV